LDRGPFLPLAVALAAVAVNFGALFDRLALAFETPARPSAG
jgi:hypothetical protein